MTQRIGGADFDITVGTELIHVETATLDIEDNGATSQTNGVPDGWVKGDKSASGEMVVSESEFKKLLAQARAAGSWEDLRPADLLFYAKTYSDFVKIEAFGCKFKISSLLNIDSKGGEKSTRTLPFEVTSPDFIHIDGVPYIGPDSLNGITE